jgi:hypothetical protein
MIAAAATIASLLAALVQILGVPLVKVFNLIAKVAAMQCTPHLWIAEIKRINTSHLSHGLRM